MLYSGLSEKVSDILRVSNENRAIQNLCYLAISTGSSISTSSTYIVKFTKNQKGKPDKMDLPLLKNDITGSEPTVKMLDT
jgi:hypothetical protein